MFVKDVYREIKIGLLCYIFIIINTVYNIIILYISLSFLFHLVYPPRVFPLRVYSLRLHFVSFSDYFVIAR